MYHFQVNRSKVKVIHRWLTFLPLGRGHERVDHWFTISSFIKREQWWDEIKKMLFTSTFLTPPLCCSSYNRVNMTSMVIMFLFVYICIHMYMYRCMHMHLCMCLSISFEVYICANAHERKCIILEEYWQLPVWVLLSKYNLFGKLILRPISHNGFNPPCLCAYTVCFMAIKFFFHWQINVI